MRNKLSQVTRWYTSRNLSKLVSLDEIVANMKEGQKEIYFLGGEDRAVLERCPIIEKIHAEGYEVILGDDPLDETIFKGFKQYKKTKIVNVAFGHIKEPYRTDQLRKEVKYLTKVYTPLI